MIFELPVTALPPPVTSEGRLPVTVLSPGYRYQKKVTPTPALEGAVFYERGTPVGIRAIYTRNNAPKKQSLEGKRCVVTFPLATWCVQWLGRNSRMDLFFPFKIETKVSSRNLMLLLLPG